PAGAEAAFRKCIALDPKMPEAHCNLGLLLGREGRFAEAVRFLSRGHELGTAQQRDGKRWDYPSAAWLARMKRLREGRTPPRGAEGFFGAARQGPDGPR